MAAPANGGGLERAIGGAVALYRGTSSERAVVALVAANLVPLLGVLLLGWSLHTILVLYWLENGIVGLWNVFRIVLAAGPIVEVPERVRPLVTLPAVGLAKAALVPFFVVHYGLFWVVHGVFVFVLPEFAGDVTGSDAFGGIDPVAVGIGAVALFLSHGVSFVLNYVGRGEYRTASPTGQMGAVYGRVVILHLTILFGAFGVAALGSPIGALVVFVGLKIAADLAFHLREHAARQRAIERSTKAP